eukprot:1729656-Pyramimonas_sp.AAC.1
MPALFCSIGMRRRRLLGRQDEPRSRLSASHVAVCRQGIYLEYSVECSKRRALNGIRASTVYDCRLLN